MLCYYRHETPGPHPDGDDVSTADGTKALPLCCASTAFLSKPAPFRAVQQQQPPRCSARPRTSTCCRPTSTSTSDRATSRSTAPGRYVRAVPDSGLRALCRRAADDPVHTSQPCSYGPVFSASWLGPDHTHHPPHTTCLAGLCSLCSAAPVSALVYPYISECSPAVSPPLLAPSPGRTLSSCSATATGSPRQTWLG
eukprot:SAG22_NODE_61_length_23387_cov_34.380582_18_plen_196_part_00